MMKFFFLAVGCFFICSTQFAQNYRTSLGLRYSNASSFGGPAITAKRFISETNAIEMNLAFGKPMALGAVYQFYKPLNSPGFHTYFGAGAYLSFNNPSMSSGIIGNIGLDYKFESIPINLSLDFRPELNVSPKANIEVTTFGFSLRYAIQ